MSKEFDDRFQDFVQKAVDQEGAPSKARSLERVVKLISIVLGFLLVSLFYGAGVKIVAIGLSFSLDVLHSFITGIGLAIIHLAFMAVTWAKK